MLLPVVLSRPLLVKAGAIAEIAAFPVIEVVPVSCCIMMDVVADRLSGPVMLWTASLKVKAPLVACKDTDEPENEPLVPLSCSPALLLLVTVSAPVAETVPLLLSPGVLMNKLPALLIVPPVGTTSAVSDRDDVTVRLPCGLGVLVVATYWKIPPTYACEVVLVLLKETVTVFPLVKSLLLYVTPLGM